jgi:hypothetical protein
MYLRRRVVRISLVIAASVSIIAIMGGGGSRFPARANSVIASDTFNRTVSSGWGSADLGGGWTVVDNASNWSVAPTTGTINVAAGAQERAVLSAVSVQDVDLLAKIVLPECPGSVNCDAYVVGRYSTGSSPTYYRIGAVQGAGRSSVYLRAQRSDGSNLASDVNTAIPASNGVVVWVRAEFKGTNPTAITARVWQDGTAEPSSWLLNIADNTSAEQGSGTIGARVRNEDWGGRHTFGYQSYVATSLTTSPPPSTSTSSSTTSSSTSTTSTTLAPPPPPPPSGAAASDTFQRSIPSGWGSADSGGWWTVVGSPWAWSVASGAGTVAAAPASRETGYLSQFNIQDTDVLERVVLPRCTGSRTNCDAFVIGRYSPSYSPTYYRVGLVQGAGNPDILLRAQRSDGTGLSSDIDTHMAASDQTAVWIRVDFVGKNSTAIRARAWLDGTTEPTAWLLNISDSNGPEQTAGKVGVRFGNEDTATSHSFAITSYQVTGVGTPVAATPNPTTAAHWMYVVDDGQVSVYDIDNGNALVKQFPIPEAGKRGVAMSPSRGLLYVAECGTTSCAGSHGSLLAYDLTRDVVSWIANYSFGVDQLAVTPDGSSIYMPHGEDATDGTHTILDASDGKPTGSVQTGTNGHNTVASLDGTQVYLGGYTGTNSSYLHVVNPANNQVILNAGPTVNGVRPFTVNGKHTLAFTTSSSTCGFQVLSLTSGLVLYTVAFPGSCSWTVSTAPSHGISISPDETRAYILDSPLDQLAVYDISGLPASAPSFVADVPLNPFGGNEQPCQTWCQREGWVLNDLSGRFVYVGDVGNVIDTRTLTTAATLPALQNTRQLIEVDWANGVISATSTRFGLGHVTS